MRLFMGTTAAFDTGQGDTRGVVAGKGRRVEVEFPDGTPLVEALRTVTDPNGVWAHQSPEPPQWVASDSAGLAAVLGEHYGCPVRKVRQ